MVLGMAVNIELEAHWLLLIESPNFRDVRRYLSVLQTQYQTGNTSMFCARSNSERNAPADSCFASLMGKLIHRLAGHKRWKTERGGRIVVTELHNRTPSRGRVLRHRGNSSKTRRTWLVSRFSRNCVSGENGVRLSGAAIWLRDYF